METHTFAKIIHYLSKMDMEGKVLSDTLIQSTIEAYVVKEQKNMSLEDIALVLNCMLSIGAISNLHTEFFNNILPSSKISNFSTLAVVLDLIGGLIINGLVVYKGSTKLQIDEALDRILAQLPYITDFPSLDLISFIPLAVMSLASARIDVPDEILNGMIEYFFQYYQFLNEKEIVLFLEACNILGVDMDDQSFLGVIETFLNNTQYQGGSFSTSVIQKELTTEAGLDVDYNRKVDRDILEMSKLDLQHVRLEKLIYYIHAYEVIKRGEKDELFSRLMAELNRLLAIPSILDKLTNQITLFRFITLLEKHQKEIPKAKKILEESNYQPIS